MTLSPGFHRGIPMSQYQALDSIGSGRLEWLATSPMHYQFMLTQPSLDTDATQLGTAVHVATLEPELFERTYCAEPDLEAIGGAKPRATKAYRDALQDMIDGGQIPLRADFAAKVRAMSAALRLHEQSAAVLERLQERELTMLWDRDGRACRGRADAFGDGAIGDVKTTRSLRDFSPWTITKMGYHRQFAWYADGAERLGRPVKHCFVLAVESSAPFDVGVFALDPEAIAIGRAHVDTLLAVLAQCEETGRWPGMFPEIQRGMVTDAVAAQALEEVA